MSKLVPFGTRLIIRPDEAVTHTKSGLVIPDRAQKLPSHGKVLAVGRGDYDQSTIPFSEFVWPDAKPVIPKVGDTVWFQKYSGVDVRFNDEDVIILHIGDILAVEEEE